MKKRGPKTPGAFEVGYRKPPAASQFQKGQSGNIRGRPKGSMNLATLLKKIGDVEVTAEIDGVRHRMSWREAALTHLYSNAAAGDRHATSDMVQYELKLKICAEHDDIEALDTMDEEVVEAVVKRIRREPEDD